MDDVKEARAGGGDGGGEGGGGGGDGGRGGGGKGAIHVLLMVSHELAGPLSVSSHVYFA